MQKKEATKLPNCLMVPDPTLRRRRCDDDVFTEIEQKQNRNFPIR